MSPAPPGGSATSSSPLRLSTALFSTAEKPSPTTDPSANGRRTGACPPPPMSRAKPWTRSAAASARPPSTLYLACLLSNLEITERYAHRYVPAYIAWGMDATVSWGGPDYKFTNNTLYPVKIVTKYEKGYLTVQILGTNVDGTYVKMSNEVLSKTPGKPSIRRTPPWLPAPRMW